MRTLLVAPPWLDIYGDFKAAAKLGCVSHPLGLLYLGGAIQQMGGECRIVDMEGEGVDADGLIRIIREYQPALVGITATTPVYKNATLLAQAIKKQLPDTLLGIGGVHSTILGRSVLEECPSFDFQAVGESEDTIQDICRAIQAGKSFDGIDGVIFRRGETIVENPRRQLKDDLDAIPMPARHLLDPDRYQHSLPGKGFVRYADLFTARGCPFHCVFCSQHTMYGRRVRFHGIQRVIDELKDITENLGVHHVIMMDETLTLNRQRTFELCQAIRDNRLNFTWEGWTHASRIDEELLRAMKAAGLIRLSFGIESGDPQILKRIKKGVTLDQIRNAYRAAAKVGIETRGSAMLGHPGETRETAWRTIKFIRGIKECQQMFLNVACPYPGTELYDCAANGRDGMKLLSTDYSRYKRYGDPVISVNDLDPKALKRLQTLGLLWFYLTPRRIWYNVFKRAGLRAGIVNSCAFAYGVLRSLWHGRGI
jgi:anaerobic magnesium-protoporphyrin IX monomethyl ester cyclase